MVNVAIFVSGSGSNCEALIKHFEGSDKIRPVLVLSNRPDAYALVRAEKYSIPTRSFQRRNLTILLY